MRFVLTGDAEHFAQRTRSILEERIECNVLATVLADVLAGVIGQGGARFAYGLDDSGTPRFAALRTPPWPMLASEVDPLDAPRLIELWLEQDPDLPGISAVAETARAIASAWARSTGGLTRCRLAEALHALEEVTDPVRPAPGELRSVRSEERELLVSWMDAFVREAGVGEAGQAEIMVDAAMARGKLMVWDDEGPVSMLGSNVSVAGAVRIGPVYTPPERRRRGYATSAVAAASRRALEHGAHRCLLYTDLANPTSNRIYSEVGYRRVADWEEHAFAPPPRS